MTTLSKDTRKLCTLAMLLAISVILGMFSLRVGAGIKISFKFIPVFICSSLFGPFYGAVCGALSDFLAFLFNPSVGYYMPQISLVEALYGISFGIFFYKASGINTRNIIKLITCLVLNTVILSIFVMSFILKELMGMTYINTIILRLPAAAVNISIHFICITLILKFLPQLKRISIG